MQKALRPAPRGILVLLLASALAAVTLGARAASHPWISTYTNATTCTACHATAAAEVMATSHWTWEHADPASGHTLGKRHVINNYCIAVASNEPRCTSCHVGVGYKDKTFNFADATKVDCLVCHDTTGTYRKFPTLAGAPWTGPGPTNFNGVAWPPVDLVQVAQNVGPTSRATCGACHFFGGGGDAVKHGDLDSSLYTPDRALDVHMGVNGQNFACSRCHQPTRHDIPGTYYPKDTTDNQRCEACHTAAPHPAGALGDRLDAHATRVSCQACHIPAFARARTTAMTWDWSTAGQKTPDGKNMVLKDANGDPIYDTQKGTFTWARGVTPEYVWYNGGMTYLTLDDVVDPAGRVAINRLDGDVNDAKSRLFPVKRFTGRQPYDVGSGKLAVPHLFGSDTNAYWRSFNWTNSLTFGMEYIGRTFSGQVGYVDTEMFWIQNHMVAPKEDALTCAECHTPRGRLNFAALGYAPARADSLQTLAGFEVGAPALAAPGGPIVLRWLGTAGHRYRVQYRDDVTGTWTDAPNGQIDTGAAARELTWEDTAAGARRFYRIVRSGA